MSGKRKQAKRPKPDAMLAGSGARWMRAMVQRIEALEREMAAQLAIRDATALHMKAIIERANAQDVEDAAARRARMGIVADYDRRHPLPKPSGTAGDWLAEPGER